jgi:hypothetical protein
MGRRRRPLADHRPVDQLAERIAAGAGAAVSISPTSVAAPAGCSESTAKPQDDEKLF